MKNYFLSVPTGLIGVLCISMTFSIADVLAESARDSGQKESKVTGKVNWSNPEEIKKYCERWSMKKGVAADSTLAITGENNVFYIFKYSNKECNFVRKSIGKQNSNDELIKRVRLVPGQVIRLNPGDKNP